MNHTLNRRRMTCGLYLICFDGLPGTMQQLCQSMRPWTRLFGRGVAEWLFLYLMYIGHIPWQKRCIRRIHVKNPNRSRNLNSQNGTRCQIEHMMKSRFRMCRRSWFWSVSPLVYPFLPLCRRPCTIVQLMNRMYQIHRPWCNQVIFQYIYGSPRHSVRPDHLGQILIPCLKYYISSNQWKHCADYWFLGFRHPGYHNTGTVPQDLQICLSHTQNPGIASGSHANTSRQMRCRMSQILCRL